VRENCLSSSSIDISANEDHFIHDIRYVLVKWYENRSKVLAGTSFGIFELEFH
jgi:hypothetical protein